MAANRYPFPRQHGRETLNAFLAKAFLLAAVSSGCGAGALYGERLQGPGVAAAVLAVVLALAAAGNLVAAVHRRGRR
jgi:hypothetical protein